MIKLVEIDHNDFQVRCWIQDDKLFRLRLILEGTAVEDLLREITFRDPHKEFKRKTFIQDLDARR